MIAVDKVEQVLERVLAQKSVQDKINIGRTYQPLGDQVSFQNPLTRKRDRVSIGDDCAAIPNADGSYMLFAAEGILPEFIEEHPWFAGYSSVMVNISDICSMGGLPVAITDVLWAKDREKTGAIWEGMKAASADYDVPIVGGHTTYVDSQTHLAVSILGKADHLLTSFGARPGDQLLMAVELNGEYFADYPFWNASTDGDPAQLRQNLTLMKTISDYQWATAAKDISMGGIIGTLAMLLNCSETGATIDIESIPRPTGCDLEKWLLSFPSFGFLITVPDDQSRQQVCALFEESGIACGQVGEIMESHTLVARHSGSTFKLF